MRARNLFSEHVFGCRRPPPPLILFFLRFKFPGTPLDLRGVLKIVVLQGTVGPFLHILSYVGFPPQIGSFFLPPFPLGKISSLGECFSKWIRTPPRGACFGSLGDEGDPLFPGGRHHFFLEAGWWTKFSPRSPLSPSANTGSARLTVVAV